MDFYFELILWILCIVTIAEGKTWSFAVGGNRRPYNYIDEDGYVKGSDLDLIQQVCRLAGKKCVVTVQETAECAKTENGRFYPGEGLMEGWFDACMGYVSSPDRENSLDFTDPFRIESSTFAVKLGNPKNFNPKDISGFVITHLYGAYTNLQCLNRLDIGTAKQIIVANGIVEAKALMRNGTADALFSPRSSFRELDVLGDTYHCSTKGTGVMVKKGSDLPSWWNPAFRRFYQSGEYTKHCQRIKEKYGGLGDPVKSCLPAYKGGSTRTSSSRLLQLLTLLSVMLFSVL